jgi:hypothetical protein
MQLFKKKEKKKKKKTGAWGELTFTVSLVSTPIYGESKATHFGYYGCNL